MAILTKIRNRSGLAIGAVGVALLLFVISDALNSNYGIFGGGRNSNDVGEIDGEKIGIKMFSQKMDEQIENYKARNPNQPIEDNTRTQLNEQTWNMILQEHIMGKEYAELGIVVSNDELGDLFYGENIHPQVRQSLSDPKTGAFDKNNVLRILKRIGEGTDEKEKKQLKDFEDYVVNDVLTRKYAQLLKKGIYASSLDAKNLYKTRTRSAEMNYVALAYNTVSDSTIKADEKDLKAYFNKNQDKYKERENSRKLEFVVWNFAPTSEDSAVVKKWAYDQVEPFRNAKNDTIFVDANSDVKFDMAAKPRGAYPPEIVNQLFSDSVGTVVGPFYREGKYQVYKISGTKEDTILYMRASHILFKAEGPTAQDTLNSKKKAEEVLAQIKKGSDFAAMAMQYGTDGTKDKGGDLGWFADGQMVKEFNTAVKNGKKGDLMIVKTQFGWHILKVTENKSKKLVCAGMLERSVEPSEKTLGKAYNEASQFAAASLTMEEFEKNVTEKKIEKHQAEFVRETDSYLPGYSDAREVVRWAYNAKKAAVSDVFTVGDKYIIAVVKDIREKGKPNFDASRTRVETDYRKDKKADQLMEKMNAAMKAGASTLQALSAKLNVTLTPVGAQSFENTNIGFIGMDNTFVGTVFGSAINKISGPVKGDAGVYAYQINKFNESPPITDYTAYKTELSGGFQQRLEYGYMDVLKDIKGVKDYRYRFF